jgi:hypothetical protein
MGILFLAAPPHGLGAWVFCSLNWDLHFLLTIVEFGYRDEASLVSFTSIRSLCIMCYLTRGLLQRLDAWSYLLSDFGAQLETCVERFSFAI